MNHDIYNDSHHPLSVGYYDPFNAFPIIEKELLGRFPLTNLHWKYDLSKPLKSIPLLPIKLVEEVPRKTISASKSGSGDCIYLRLMLVKCDSIDIYRSQVRPLIKEWLNNMVTSTDSEWMIMLVVPSNAKDKHSTIIKLSILDKLKIDFGIDGKELTSSSFARNGNRIFKVKEKFEDESIKLEVYTSIVNQIKELVLSKFTIKFTELQKKIHNQSKNIFDNVLTELNLAELFNDMRLYEDSLRYYKLLGNSIDKIITSDPKLFEFGAVESIIPSNLDNYVFEHSIKIQNVRNNLIKKDASSISLLELKCFLFVKQASLLQSLASHSSTLSISASYIASFYQKLLIFLNDITVKAVKCPNVLQVKLYQWSFTLIDTYLNSTITKYIFKKSNDNTLNNSDAQVNQIHPLHEILECMGELKLFQRTLLVNLGRLTRNYVLHGAKILEEVDLAEDDYIQKKVEEKFELSYSPLLSALETECTFLESFQRITESTIQDFAAANREKSIDILSIDIALVKYYQKNYSEALQILEDSSEFFINNGWNFMGGLLLEAYLSCIENLSPKNSSNEARESRNRLICMTCLNLLSNLRTGEILASTGINNYNLIKSTDSVSKLFEKIFKYSNLLNDSFIEYDVNKIFDVTVCPHIQSEQNQIDSDSYFIDIQVLNKFEVEIETEQVLLELRNDSNEGITFFTNKCTLLPSPKLTTIRLFTTNSILGIFRISKFSISMNNNMKFTRHFSNSVRANTEDFTTSLNDDQSQTDVDFNGDNSVVYSFNRTNEWSILKTLRKQNRNTSRLPLSSSFQIISFPRPENLWFEFINPINLELGKTDILLRIHGGNANSSNVDVNISSLTPGVTIKNDEISLVGTDENNKFKSNCILINQIPMKSFVDIRIPYVYFSDSNKYIKMKATVSYQIGSETFSFTAANGVDTTLTISVSVQDIFKIEHIFSKFQVGTSNPKYPIRVISNKLSSPTNSNYNIEKPMKDPGSIVAFGEQPASYFYKIYPNTSFVPKSEKGETLDLVIQYSNLQDEAQQIFEVSTLRKIRSVNLESYWLLFKSVLSDMVAFNINQFALSGKVQIENGASVLNIVNNLIVNYIPEEADRLILQRIFEQLLMNSEVLNQDPENRAHADIKFKSLSIRVPVPHLRILHIVEFKFENTTQLIVGEALKAKLEIQPSKRWSLSHMVKSESTTEQSLSTGNDNKEASPNNGLVAGGYNPRIEQFLVNFIPDDNWLISGFKKTSFEIDYSANQLTRLEFDLVLIPLNVGKLLLPKLDVRSLSSDSNIEEISMDIVFKNGLEPILVVPELDSITFSF
ncbi:trafficking protein particle complex II-specific subunit 130 [[Candida] railenensis]|uniref:Trafficking protein particle complex II-specific subunit 130 n=1 Tax=[Candida] railenensis TaxID=45579 RepID=A0A9P0W1E0_9ASCO|nr:trafficking protein particle complex II-specific subunit 130 [[Candida] railenensis]